MRGFWAIPVIALCIANASCLATSRSAQLPLIRDVSTSPSGPLYDADPPSTLLATGMTSFTLTLSSQQPGACRYSLGSALPWAQMSPFIDDGSTTAHAALITGIDPNPAVVNELYVRTEAQPDSPLHLRYRCLSAVNPKYPRKGNLWGCWNFIPKGMAYCARIDLWLGADFTSQQISQLRALNPDILILPDINTVENFNLPDDYYLKDVNGSKIEVWPNVYRLNLTKGYVADYQAQYAYDKVVTDGGLLVDGCFFDNFMTSQSWLTEDIHGNAIEIDADENGIADDPDELDAAWRAGVYRELRAWRRLMPYALASGHLPEADPEVAEIFNGDSIGFTTADVLDGKRAFSSGWKEYHDWCNLGRRPGLVMVESTPPDQIAYGYDYQPLTKIPASTLQWAKSYYPYVRFGLMLTLMNSGYFAQEFGDTDHGQDWWCDELDHDLGQPLGPAARIPIDIGPNPNLMTDGGFESALSPNWGMWVNTSAGCAATVVRDTTDKAVGSASAHINVTNTGEGVNWHIDFHQLNRSLAAGQDYDLIFWAKTGPTTRTLTLSCQKGSPDWRNYGLYDTVDLSSQWQEYTVAWQANETVSDARILFFVGDALGDVWLDEVRLVKHPPDVYRRDFSNGVVLLNGTKETRTIGLETGLRHITGDQAPKHQYMLDDSTSGVFTSSGPWQTVTIESGEWKDSGPFYHDWGPDCHLLNGTTGQGQWDLRLPEGGVYTIQAWWPADPASSGRSSQVVYELVSGGSVLTSCTLDQRTGGDEWHTIASSVALDTSGAPSVRIRNTATGSCVADALHVFSQARLNDGSVASSVTLPPLDGIMLKRADTTAVGTESRLFE